MLPDPREVPLLRVDEALCVWRKGRSSLYEAINRGEIPTLTYGRNRYIVNALWQQQLGLIADGPDPPHDEGSAATRSLAPIADASTTNEDCS